MTNNQNTPHEGFDPTQLFREFFALPPTKASEEETKAWWQEKMMKTLNYIGVNAKTAEELDYFYKISGAIGSLDMLEEFLLNKAKPCESSTPKLLCLMWHSREVLLPLVREMKGKMIAQLDERGLCVDFMKRKINEE